MTPTLSDRSLITARLLPFPRERVFAAFAAAAALAEWWGPRGFTNTFHTFDFQSGGQWLFTMHGPDGRDYENESVFQEISRPGRIVIEHVCQPKFVLEITLAEHAEGTWLTWTQTFESPEMRDKIAKLIGHANEENLDRLAAVLAK